MNDKLPTTNDCGQSIEGSSSHIAAANRKAYDYRCCISLFGYAASVHVRSGGVCQLCGCESGSDVDFDLWRQFSVEHLIGEKQQGYLKDIQRVVASRFPELSLLERNELAAAIDEANTVTACSFCNSTTSRVCNERSMEELILETQGEGWNVIQAVRKELQRILQQKRADVASKIQAVRAAFEERVKPHLFEARAALQAGLESRHIFPAK